MCATPLAAAFSAFRPSSRSGLRASKLNRVKKAEFLIIGGGVVGASVACHLTEGGARGVVILEREGRQGLGSTGKATGGVRAQFETEINIRLSKYSIDFFRERGGVFGYRGGGYLFFTCRDDGVTYLRANIESQRRNGVVDVDLLGPNDVRKIVPEMHCDDVAGGAFGHSDGFIDPLAVMEVFTARAVECGARVETGADVLEIATANGAVTGVKTSIGSIECEKVVLCAGAWSRPLAATAGVDLPVEPMRRQIVWARSPEPLPTRLPMVIDLDTGFHFRPAKNSETEVLLAYPDPDETPSLSTEFDPAFVEKVYERARRRAPFLAETEPVLEKCRAGLYENTPDHHAILGTCGVEGLYLACGFSGHGVMHSPATGRALSEIILDGESKFLDVSCLSIDRFRTGELLHETAFI